MNDQQIADGLKKIQKEILEEIHRICVKHDIKYFLAYGTLIGAIRHDGFIPWDDDIDIMMPYEDMLKFENVCKNELDHERFFYQTPDTDPEYRLSINRMRKNNTLLVEERYKNKKIHQGIFVDIYPLYGVPNGKLSRNLQVFRAMKRALYLLDEAPINQGTLMKVGATIMLKLKTKKGKEKAQRKLLEKIAKYKYDESDWVACLDSGLKTMRTVYPKDYYGKGKLHKFDELEVIIPDNYDEILKKTYGNYMELPPVEQRKFHHDFSEIKLTEGKN